MGTRIERHVLIDDRDPWGLATCFDDEVIHVARVMPLGIQQPMFFPIRIQMGPGRLKIRPYAGCILMEVQGMLPRGQILNMQQQFDPGAGGFDLDVSGALSRAVFHLYLYALGGAGQGKGEDDQWQNNRKYLNTLHGLQL